MVKAQPTRLFVGVLLVAGTFVCNGQRTLSFAGGGKPNTAGATDAGWPDEVVANTKVVVKDQAQAKTMKPDDPRLPGIQKEIQTKLDKTDSYLKLAPTNVPLLTAAADQSFQTGNIPQAQSRTAQALSNAQPGSPEWASAMNEHAKIAEQLGDFKTAEADSLQVMQTFPDNQDAVARYQINKERNSAPAASTKAGLAAKKIAAAMEGPQFSPGGFHASTNDDPRLKATAQNVAALGRMKDGKRLLDMGDAEGAISAAQAAAAASPAFAADSAVMQAQAWAVLKDLSKALVQISTAIKLFAEQGRKRELAAAYSQRAAFQNDLKNHADAVSDADHALEADPKLASAFYERARGAESLGKTEQALADIDQAAALDAGFMADRDDFHKRHRAGAQPDDVSSGPVSTLAGRLKSVGFLNLGVAFAGLVLLGVAGYVVRLASKGSPVRRITWARAFGGARGDDGPRDLNDQYKIVKKIGEGGMGTVYEGYDKNLKRPVAIKRLRPELQRNARERARFIKEAELVAALQHPHTVQIYTILYNDEDTHIVFEYIVGQTLHELLNASPGRHLEPRRALELLRQIAEAVDHAHERHVIHRDLKPANVMVDQRGWAKVMDFGIARQVADSLVHTTTNTIVGTPTYMAPEQSMGEVKKESDVYALGITLYEMLTGGLPFKGAEDMNEKLSGRFLAPSLLLPGLPPSIDAVIAKAIAPRADDRYHSCMDLYRAAESALGQMTPS
jgi:tRNA A-37 threonylcarbamoyl transferase component Bud32/tetratricopeptide (TPR) repeat protein